MNRNKIRIETSLGTVSLYRKHSEFIGVYVIKNHVHKLLPFKPMTR